MDFSSLKFAASMAADAAKDRLNSTLSTTHARAQELAAGSMESLQTRMASASDAVSRTANDVRSFDVSRLDPTKMDVSSSLNTLHESVIQTAAHASSIVESAASTTLSTTINIGSGSWPATEPNGSSSQGEGEGSDGEGVRIGRGLFSSWGAAAEKQTLLGGESGGAYAGVLGGGLTQLSTSAAALGASVWGGSPKEPEGPVGRACACLPALSYKQRLLGSIVCFVFGVILSLSALNSLPSLLLGNAAPFAFKYTFGNLLSIGSSTFLVGPVKQCQDMATPERFIASVTYLVTLFLTLFSVFKLKIQLISFGLVIVQFCALSWYHLSYVPYGQQCVKRLIQRMM